MAVFAPLDATGIMQWRNSAFWGDIDLTRMIIEDLEQQVMKENFGQILSLATFVYKACGMLLLKASGSLHEIFTIISSRIAPKFPQKRCNGIYTNT